MSEASTTTLFDSVPLTAEPAAATADKLARELVRWCFSFGPDFHNSPDVINLRSWAKRSGLNIKDAEEAEVLAEARRLYLKRIDQLIRKADAPSVPADPSMIPDLLS